MREKQNNSKKCVCGKCCDNSACCKEKCRSYFVKKAEDLKEGMVFFVRFLKTFNEKKSKKTYEAILSGVVFKHGQKKAKMLRLFVPQTISLPKQILDGLVSISSFVETQKDSHGHCCGHTCDVKYSNLKNADVFDSIVISSAPFEDLDGNGFLKKQVNDSFLEEDVCFNHLDTPLTWPGEISDRILNGAYKILSNYYTKGVAKRLVDKIDLGDVLSDLWSFHIAKSLEKMPVNHW